MQAISSLQLHDTLLLLIGNYNYIYVIYYSPSSSQYLVLITFNFLCFNYSFMYFLIIYIYHVLLLSFFNSFLLPKYQSRLVSSRQINSLNLKLTLIANQLQSNRSLNANNTCCLTWENSVECKSFFYFCFCVFRASNKYVYVCIYVCACQLN